MLFAHGIRVLVVAGLLALAVIAFPPWFAERYTGRLGMGDEIFNPRTDYEFLGWAPLWAAPESQKIECGMMEFSCFTFLEWRVLGAELAVLALLAGVAFLVDRRGATPRAV